MSPDRYEILHRKEENGVGRLKDYWFIVDTGTPAQKRKGKAPSKIIAKFWIESHAIKLLEMLNYVPTKRRKKHE